MRVGPAGVLTVSESSGSKPTGPSGSIASSIRSSPPPVVTYVSAFRHFTTPANAS
jgi:hypothetical protein